MNNHSGLWPVLNCLGPGRGVIRARAIEAWCKSVRKEVAAVRALDRLVFI